MRIRYGKDENGRAQKKAIVYTREEHGIRIGDVDRDAIGIVSRLKGAGYEAYIVGGAVRDLMLGERPKDFDIVSAATPQQIKRIFRNSRIIGRRFRLVHVYFGQKIIEAATFRSMRNGPTGNTFGTIEEDVMRRDFTVNAFFYDPVEETVVDYVDGMKDFRSRRLRPIIPLETIFRDDPVRMVRAAKYAATTGFAIPWSLARKIKKEAPLLGEISPSRLTEEINKVIHSGKAYEILLSLLNLGLYSCLQPNADAKMKSDPAWKLRYQESFRAAGALNASAASPPEDAIFSCLIKDFLEDAFDWKNTDAEQYKDALAQARRFVLPMNPPRIYLEKAVRLVFREHGVTVLRKAPERRYALERTAGSSRNRRRSRYKQEE